MKGTDFMSDVLKATNPTETPYKDHVVFPDDYLKELGFRDITHLSVSKSCFRLEADSLTLYVTDNSFASHIIGGNERIFHGIKTKQDLETFINLL